VNPIYRRAAIALVSGVAVASLIAPTAATAEPAHTATTRSASAAAAGYLARQLGGAHKDHYFYPGTTFADDGATADAVLSMDAAGVAQAGAKRATSWLEKDARNYLTGGGYTKHAYPGQAGKLALVAAAQHANPTKFGGMNLIRTIVRSEGAGAGTRHGQYQNADDVQYGSSVTLQSLAMLGLAAARPHRGPDHAAKAFLARQACRNGGFPNDIRNGTACGTEDIDATALAVQALVASKAKKSVISDAVRFLTRHENSDGGWGETPGTGSDANSTALAIEALITARHKVGKAERWLAGEQVGCRGAVLSRGAVRFQPGKFDPATGLRATTQAGAALARKPLVTIDRRGATSAAPRLSCSRAG
jgi:hypothetical protein